MSKKLEGRFVCRCECGGQVRGISSFGRMFTWCEKCTPVVKVQVSAVFATDETGTA